MTEGPSNTDSDLADLVTAGCDAHSDGRYADELAIWKQVAKREPGHLRWQANLAMAFHLTGQTEQAVVLFTFVIDQDPSVSQAHNNLASIAMEGGAPPGVVLPALSYALLASESYPHFQRHLLNCSMAASLSSDTEGLEWLSGIRDLARRFLDRKGDASTDHLQFVDDVIEAYSHYARVRECMAIRDWTGISRSLDQAKAAFEELDLQIELQRIAATRPLIELMRATLMFFESCANEGTSIEDAASALEELHECATVYYEKAGNLGHSSLVNLLGWFIAEFKRQIRWLREPTVDYDEVSHTIPSASIAAIAASEYTELGERTIHLLAQTNRSLETLARRWGSLAAQSARNAERRRCWSRIRLHIGGTLLDFSGIEEELVREMTGWRRSGAERFLSTLQEFRAYVEGQASKDIFVDGKPQENIGRALLQAFLANRGYREVPIRGGRVDVLIIERDETFLVETKIWRGPQNHDDGMSELLEYMEGGAIPRLSAGFYVVFDPTTSSRAEKHISSVVCPPGVMMLAISISLPIPSKKAAQARTEAAQRHNED